MDTEVAPVTSHCNTDEFPATMLVGLDIKLIMAGRSGVVLTRTITVVEARAEPELFVAVKLYVVVTVGDTDCVPEDGTAPIP
jgi:hypothetical protein